VVGGPARIDARHDASASASRGRWSRGRPCRPLHGRSCTLTKERQARHRPGEGLATRLALLPRSHCTGLSTETACRPQKSSKDFAAAAAEATRAADEHAASIGACLVSDHRVPRSPRPSPSPWLHADLTRIRLRRRQPPPHAHCASR
jgi:hypothetical protein